MFRYRTLSILGHLTLDEISAINAENDLITYSAILLYNGKQLKHMIHIHFIDEVKSLICVSATMITMFKNNAIKTPMGCQFIANNADFVGKLHTCEITLQTMYGRDVKDNVNYNAMKITETVDSEAQVNSVTETVDSGTQVNSVTETVDSGTQVNSVTETIDNGTHCDDSVLKDLRDQNEKLIKVAQATKIAQNLLTDQLKLARAMLLECKDVISGNKRKLEFE